MRYLCCLLVLALVVPASANLLTNGGFENGDLTGWTNVAGTGGGSAQVFNTGDWSIPNNPEGGKWAGWVSGWDTSRHNAYIYQQFTQPTNVTLDFVVSLYANVVGAGDWSVGVDVFYDPNGGTDISQAQWIAGEWNQYNTEWATYSGAMPAGTGSSATGTVFVQTFHNWAVQWNQSGVDNFSVTPEPASLVLLGLGGLALLRRRR